MWVQHSVTKCMCMAQLDMMVRGSGLPYNLGCSKTFGIRARVSQGKCKVGKDFHEVNASGVLPKRGISLGNDSAACDKVCTAQCVSFC